MLDDKPVEVELKLAATADAMDTLLASPLLREHARSTVRSRNLVTTYYDTADQRLSRRGLAFRVRQVRQEIHPDAEDGERRRGRRDGAWRMGGGASPTARRS